MLVHDDEAALVGLHARRVEAQPLGVGNAAHGGQHVVDLGLVRLALGVLERDVHAVVLDVRLLEARRRVDVHAALLVGALHELGDIFVLEREDALERLDDGDLGAVGGVDVGELHPDGAGAHDQERPGRLLLHERAGGGPDAVLVDLQDRQIPRPRPRRDDDVLRLDGALGAVGTLDLDLTLPLQAAEPLDVRDLVLLEEVRDAAVHLIGHGAAPLLRGAEIEGDLLGDDAVLLAVLHLVDQERAREQRLGGDAADVEADATELVDLDARHAQAELRRADRRHVATRSAADDRNVEAVAILLASHALPRSWKRGGQPPDHLGTLKNQRS